ncbi:amidohydrolase family protein [Arthrobacter sp. AK01]|uniref:amidohydrolase family protein n=1 Tax=Micrococcaceae TaxID=1268 RepID=UPI001E4A5027|nr:MULTISPECIES: amidohydrolase family protein [Micrococcaceae]MCD4853424.1 amidohydrolase family protein [Arthrobacter sp. AK01]MCP1413772.1 cytosine deaminase [Paenarthrobacter sp. A20]
MTSVFFDSFVLRSVTLSSAAVKVDVHLRDGAIEKVVPLDARERPHAGSADAAGASPNEMDMDGYLLLPSPVEPHAHLDKALLGRRVPNRTGDLAGAIEAIKAAYPSMTRDDIGRRSLLAVTEALTRGYTAVRTHVDCREEIGTTGIEAIVDLKRKLTGIIDLQIVALAGEVGGDDGAPNRSTLQASLELGADIVGGVPSLERNPKASLRELMAIAGDARCGIDLHIDETTDPDIFVLRQLARSILSSGFAYPVTASHCVSLGTQSADAAREAVQLIADSGMSIVTLPQTNLFLQGRGSTTRKPRGLTAIEDLLASGVTVAAGSDNWRDPFNPMGRIDALETASLLVSAGHLMPGDAYVCTSTGARRAMGLPEVRVAAGYPADLLAIRANSLEEAMASGTLDRVVLKDGRVVARTEVAVNLSSHLQALIETADY